ncbi:MAG: D-alanine--poly(phosphoribitol) ligase subunit DltC [Clostridiales Family XIII bacterium]|nr:D-alanine--poly(phosphoribitol) ligase subunit DltC [Clostridiales Family XIII bacterium]
MMLQLVDILEELTGVDAVRENPDLQLFENDLLDSFGVVQLIVEIESRLGIAVPVSLFDRETWGTPAAIAARLEEIQEEG